MDEKLPYHFTIKEFEYNGYNYRVALTPDLYPEDDGLEFTGSYHGILISDKSGTRLFTLEPDTLARWVVIPKGLDPGLVDILDNIITEISTG